MGLMVILSHVLTSCEQSAKDSRDKSLLLLGAGAAGIAGGAVRLFAGEALQAGAPQRDSRLLQGGLLLQAAAPGGALTCLRRIPGLAGVQEGPLRLQ